jgi:hypothetical protein
VVIATNVPLNRMTGPRLGTLVVGGKFDLQTVWNSTFSRLSERVIRTFRNTGFRDKWKLKILFTFNLCPYYITSLTTVKILKIHETRGSTVYVRR